MYANSHNDIKFTVWHVTLLCAYLSHVHVYIYCIRIYFAMCVRDKLGDKFTSSDFNAVARMTYGEKKNASLRLVKYSIRARSTPARGLSILRDIFLTCYINLPLLWKIIRTKYDSLVIFLCSVHLPSGFSAACIYAVITKLLQTLPVYIFTRIYFSPVCFVMITNNINNVNFMSERSKGTLIILFLISSSFSPRINPIYYIAEMRFLPTFFLRSVAFSYASKWHGFCSIRGISHSGWWTIFREP